MSGFKTKFVGQKVDAERLAKEIRDAGDFAEVFPEYAHEQGVFAGQQFQGYAVRYTGEERESHAKGEDR